MQYHNRFNVFYNNLETIENIYVVSNQVHHAKAVNHDDIIILQPNWLTTSIFAHIFADRNFRANYKGLEQKHEYSDEDLRHLFKHIDDPQLLIQLLVYFELAFRYLYTF